MLEPIVSLIVAFLVVATVTPSAISMLRERGMTGVDVHKPDRPVVPKGGGFVVLFAIASGLLVVIGMTTFIEGKSVDVGLLAALVAVLMAGMIGLLDDNLDFKNRTKIILPLVASVPMAALNVGTSTMAVPFLGTLDLGVVYPLVVVPLMMTFIIDSTNMYGGMNGLEAGLSTVNASAVLIYLALAPLCDGSPLTGGEANAVVVAAALLGASAAFLIFNRYPARILPGDVGRLPLGAAMAAALILGNMDRLAVILYAPFLLNFLLYIAYRIYVRRTRIEYAKFASPREDGTLEVVGPFTVYWILPYLTRITEKRNVMALVILQAVIAYAGVAFVLLS